MRRMGRSASARSRSSIALLSAPPGALAGFAGGTCAWAQLAAKPNTNAHGHLQVAAARLGWGGMPDSALVIIEIPRVGMG
jgi:hypothetical protein